MGNEIRSNSNAGGEQARHIMPVLRHRFVLLHYHIFKNAGSTIEFVLRRAFGEHFTTLHGPNADSILSGSDIVEFLERHPEITAISSHHLKYPKPPIPGMVLFDVCILRNPMDRLWSMYKHFRRADSPDELSVRAKELDAGSFFDLLIQDHPHLVNDVQVNVLANGSAYTRPPGSADLTVALKILHEMSVVGVVDLFDQSLVAAEYFLHPAFPTLRFEYVKQNVSESNENPREEFSGAVRAAIYQQLQRMNQLDSKLLSCARDEVGRRLELVPGVPERLRDFRQRCRFPETGEPVERAGAPAYW